MERKKSVMDGFSDVISATRATELPAGSAMNGSTSTTSEAATTLRAVTRQATAAQHAREQGQLDEAEHPQRHASARR